MFAVYCRVSSTNQKTGSQKEQLNRWLKANRVADAQVIWFEDKQSGRSLARPAFEKMQRAIFDGAVDTVVVWKLDRISRRITDGINALADWCDRGIRVVSVTQQIDLSGPVGRMIASVMFGVAEIENEYRAERQAAGISIAKKRGVYQGRKYGTTKADSNRAVVLNERGLTNSEIANALGVSTRTVSRYLKTRTRSH